MGLGYNSCTHSNSSMLYKTILIAKLLLKLQHVRVCSWQTTGNQPNIPVPPDSLLSSHEHTTLYGVYLVWCSDWLSTYVPSPVPKRYTMCYDDVCVCICPSSLNISCRFTLLVAFMPSQTGWSFLLLTDEVSFNLESCWRRFELCCHHGRSSNVHRGRGTHSIVM